MLEVEEVVELSQVGLAVMGVVVMEKQEAQVPVMLAQRTQVAVAVLRKIMLLEGLEDQELL